MTELIDLWQAWANGSLKEDIRLWGMQLFWWGRIGIILSIVSVLAIFVEVIGLDRFGGFGESLRDTLVLDRLGPLMSRPEVEKYISGTDSLQWITKGSFLVLLMISLGTLIALVVAARSFIKVLSFALSVPKLGTAIKVTTGILLLIGLHFDVLAS